MKERFRSTNPMMYTVTNCTFDHEFETKYGKFYSYSLLLEDREGIEREAYLNQKPETPEPMIGSTMDLDVEEDKYGKLKATKIPQQQSAPAPRPSAPSAPRTQPMFTGDDQDKQRMIIRQSALKAAVDLFGIKAQSMSAEEVKTYITKERIVEVAKYFAKYSETGEVE